MIFLYLIMVIWGFMLTPVSALFMSGKLPLFYVFRQGFDQHGHVFGRMVQHNPHPQGHGKPGTQGEGGPHHQGRPPPPPKWVPHWPPNGYALVIQMPMSAEEYFPIWRREVPVPHVPAPIAPAPQQMKMGEDLPSLDDEGWTCFLRIPEFQKAVRCLSVILGNCKKKTYRNRCKTTQSYMVYWLYAIEIPVIYIVLNHKRKLT